MYTLIRRAVRVLLVVTLIPLAATFSTGEAAAGEDEFTFLHFPHDAVEVEFFNDWGAGRPGGRRHRGTDVFSEKLTPLVAVADGFVERIKYNKRSGWYIKLRHADGWDTYYMHLNNDTEGSDDGRAGQAGAVVEGLEVGDYVAAGQQIGWVGDSGNAEWTKPHTHFELHRNGKAINPHRYLEAAWERELRLHDLADQLR